MSSGVLRTPVTINSSVFYHRKTRTPSCTTRVSLAETGATRGLKRSRPTQAFPLNTLISDPIARRSRTAKCLTQATLLEDEQSPAPETSSLNGVTDDWSAVNSTPDWDGKLIDTSTGRVAAVTSLVVVAGACYFCVRLVGTLMNRRSELAKFIPHPTAFTRTTTAAPKSTKATTEVLTPTPLPQDTTSAQISDSQQEPIGRVKDSAAVVDVDADGNLVETSQVDDQEARDEAKLFEGNESLGVIVDSFDPLPVELTEGNLRERAQLAIRAASNATGAAQRASAFAAAASTAATKAASASREAMAAAALAHVALESGNIEQMTTAQAEAWKTAQLAAEAERKAAEAAVLATKYEDSAAEQTKVAQELSVIPTDGMLRAFWRKVVAFFGRITRPIVCLYTGVVQWLAGAWAYFMTGPFAAQVTSFVGRCVASIKAAFTAMFLAVKNAVLYVFNAIANFFSGVFNGVKGGLIAIGDSFKSFVSKLQSPKGPVAGGASN